MVANIGAQNRFFVLLLHVNLEKLGRPETNNFWFGKDDDRISWVIELDGEISIVECEELSRLNRFYNMMLHLLRRIFPVEGGDSR